MKNSDNSTYHPSNKTNLLSIYSLPLSTSDKKELGKWIGDIAEKVASQLDDCHYMEGLELLSVTQKTNIVELLDIQKQMLNLIKIDKLCACN